MKATAAINSLCCLALPVLALWLLSENRKASLLASENEALRQKLTLANAPALPAPTVPDSAPATISAATAAPVQEVSTAEDVVSELQPLQTEAKALRAQTNQLASLRAETANLRAAREARWRAQSFAPPANGTAAQLEIVEAQYGTSSTNLDVADELRDRIRSGSLKAIASNKLKGDPQFGTPKQLTVVYRWNRTTFTNQFNEGDYFMLPREEATQ